MLNQSTPKKAGTDKKAQGNNLSTVVATKNALNITRRFTRVGVDPLSAEAGVFWEKRNANITDANGKVIFEQSDVEVPTTWSQTATNIVVNKYFRGTPGTKERENSVRQLVCRVADTMTSWGVKGKYFATEADKETFHDELLHLLVTQ